MESRKAFETRVHNEAEARVSERKAQLEAQEQHRQHQETSKQQEAALYRQQLNGKIAELKAAANQARSGSFGFLNTIGDSGTVATAFCMSVLTHYGRRVAMAADMHPSNGTLATLLGMDAEDATINVDQLHADQYTLCADAVTLWDKIRPNEYGTFVLDSTKDYTNWISPNDCIEVIGIIQAFHSYVGMDIPLDIASKAVQAAIKSNDVLVTTAWANNDNSLKQMKATVSTLSKDPDLRARMKNCMAIILGGSPEQVNEPEWFRDYIGFKTEVEDQSVSPRIIVIPHDPALYGTGAINMEQWRPQTVTAFVDCVQVLLEHLRCCKETHRQRLIRPTDVRLPLPTDVVRHLTIEERGSTPLYDQAQVNGSLHQG